MVLRTTFSSICGLLIAAATYGAAAADDNAQLALAARKVLETHCHLCHNGTASDKGEFDVLVDKTLIQKPSNDSDKALIAPGKPEESRILERIVLGEMPPEEVKEKLTAVEAEAVRRWIAAGAPPYPEAKTRPHVSVADVLSASRDDLREADVETRPYLRYFTLTHISNNRAIPDEDLRRYRAALSKAVNSLSWKRAIVIPRAIDKGETIFAVDVRKLDWDRADLWSRVTSAYPYALRYKNHPDDALHSLDEDVHQLTNCDLAIVRADWFVSEATRPPLYHILLQLPTHAADLETMLNVDVEMNYKGNELQRAGFFPSGVSGQNRLLERHESGYGAYWKSYDFKKDSPRMDLKRFPLGPTGIDEEYKNQAFLHDGGEIIFHLPNGLQGYLLVDGQDRRIDKGPVEVVSDSLKSAGTSEIVTGVSCMACHKQGMIGFSDQIRDGASVFGAAQNKVRQLYAKKDEMDRLIKQDTDQFMASLEKAIGPFIQVGPDIGKPITAFTEPVGGTARLYRLTPLDLQAVACELGLEHADDLLKKIGENRFRELGLTPLLNGDRLDRQQWNSGQGMSLMQRVARELGATPWQRLAP